MRRRTLLLAGFAWAASVCSPAAPAQPEDENRVKAAFLLRFAQFVEWPRDAFPQPSTPLVIGIIGAPAIASELAQMAAGRAAQDRPVVVRALKGNDDPGQIHMLFFGAEEKARLAQHVGVTRRSPVLVVTESPNALDQGSMINFVVLERRVRFEIALEAAEKAGLVLSSRLLAVAMRVHKGQLPAGSTLALLRD